MDHVYIFSYCKFVDTKPLSNHTIAILLWHFSPFQGIQSQGRWCKDLRLAILGIISPQEYRESAFLLTSWLLF